MRSIEGISSYRAGGRVLTAPALSMPSEFTRTGMPETKFREYPSRPLALSGGKKFSSRIIIRTPCCPTVATRTKAHKT
jgi:hypothetical protein